MEKVMEVMEIMERSIKFFLCFSLFIKGRR
nr:MAG TPA: hypothetical protein [Caudoviricetes sp.]DAS82186.1 MAG TPA: hypothetical protein [Caudoviricetes sp.]